MTCPALEGITIVTVCMNRQEHLARSAWQVAQWPYHQTHLIIDWSSNSPISRSDLPDDARIHLVRVDKERYWSPACAYNFGFAMATTKFVMRMDADCWPETTWDPRPMLCDEVAYVGQGGEGRFGQFLLPLEIFMRAGGFNEHMIGWGFEDKDLRYRISNQLGVSLIEIDNSFIGVLRHSNVRRVSGQGVQSETESLAALRASRHRNRLIAAFAPHGALSRKSAYSENLDGSWSLCPGTRPRLQADLCKKVNEAMRRCFWGSYLALPERVVELLPEKLLPAQHHGHWSVRWWHRGYALLIRPILLLPVHALSLLRGMGSFLAHIFSV